MVVVDNAGDQHERAGIDRLVQPGANLGFAAGSNLGAADASGDVLVFLNPDAVVEPGAVARLCDALAADPKAGIAGGGLRDEDGSWQPGAARFGVLAHLVGDTTLGRLGARRRTEVHAVDWVYGTFLAIRRAVFDALGGFDGSYFLYGEDLDLCHRARALGWRTLHVPAARATHARNVSATTRFGLGRDAAVVEGELRFYARRLGAGAARRYRIVAATKFGLKALLARLTGRTTTAERATRVVRVCLGARAETLA